MTKEFYMAKVFGFELAEQIRKSIENRKQIIADRNRRISNWETDEDDCFMSIKLDDEFLCEAEKQLKILATDGTQPFSVIVDNEGNVVRTHWFTNKWGGNTIVGNGVFASSVKALLKKTGWHEETRNYPVWTKFVPNGTGLCGVYGGSYQTVRWHTNMVTGEYVGFDN